MPRKNARPEATLDAVPEEGRALVQALNDAQESGIVLAHIRPPDARRLAGALVRGLAGSPRTTGDRARLLLQLVEMDMEGQT